MVNDRTQKVYLTRRNLLTLLSKLDRDADGEQTSCAILKYRNNDVPEYQQTMNEIMVIAVQDEDYYSSQKRAAGMMHPSEESKLSSPSTGVVYSGSIL